MPALRHYRSDGHHSKRDPAAAAAHVYLALVLLCVSMGHECTTHGPALALACCACHCLALVRHGTRCAPALQC